MWNLTMKTREQAERAHIITIPESDKEWEEYLQDEENIAYYIQRL